MDFTSPVPYQQDMHKLEENYRAAHVDSRVRHHTQTMTDAIGIE